MLYCLRCLSQSRTVPCIPLLCGIIPRVSIYVANLCLTACISSLLGILVYKLVISNVNRSVSFGRFKSFKSQRRGPLSLIYSFKSGTSGFIKWSTNCEMRSVGH